MSSSTMTSGLVSTWVTTVDPRGHVHLEAHWAPAPSAAAAPAPTPASPVPANAA
jgi:hypothetical protein